MGAKEETKGNITQETVNAHCFRSTELSSLTLPNTILQKDLFEKANTSSFVIKIMSIVKISIKLKKDT